MWSTEYPVAAGRGTEETRRRLETQLNKHKDACMKGELKKSATVKYALAHSCHQVGRDISGLGQQTH